MSNFSAIYVKNSDIVARKIEGELILVPVKSDKKGIQSIYTLNKTAAYIWNLFDGERMLDQIKDRIASDFEVSEQRSGDDLIKFAEKLEKVGVIKKN